MTVTHVVLGILKNISMLLDNENLQQWVKTIGNNTNKNIKIYPWGCINNNCRNIQYIIILWTMLFLFNLELVPSPFNDDDLLNAAHCRYIRKFYPCLILYDVFFFYSALFIIIRRNCKTNRQNIFIATVTKIFYLIKNRYTRDTYYLCLLTSSKKLGKIWSAQ